MCWHIIYIKCDKGCVSVLLSCSICRLKTFVCPPDIIATAGSSSGASPGVTGGKCGLRAHRRSNPGAAWRRDGRDGALARGSLLGGRKESHFFPHPFSHPDGSGKSQEYLGLSCRGQASLAAQLPAAQEPPSRGCRASPAEPPVPSPLAPGGPGQRGAGQRGAGPRGRQLAGGAPPAVKSPVEVDGRISGGKEKPQSAESQDLLR